MDATAMWVVVCKSEDDGDFDVYGPFSGYIEAEEWGKKYGEGYEDWSVAPVFDPTELRTTEATQPAGERT